MGVRNYLIEGVSGTGKTTVAEERFYENQRPRGQSPGMTKPVGTE
ncbi:MULTISPECIES: cleavage and polyadenylation specificity factor subunit 6 [unclassified Rhizobium]|nr:MULTISPECIES: cleavage and polyadenylation specificity factor subunit 6 [unclassified Rhizobium]